MIDVLVDEVTALSEDASDCPTGINPQNFRGLYARLI